MPLEQTAASEETTRETTGEGTPKEMPPARQYSDAQVNAIAAKHKREGEKLGRQTILETYGIESEDELAELLNAGRKTREPKKSDSDRQLEKLQAEYKKREEQREVELAKERERANTLLLRDAARSALSKHKLVKGAEELILAALGMMPFEQKAAVKDNNPTVVDKDGDPVGSSIEEFIDSFIKERLFLVEGVTTGAKPGSKTPHPSGNGSQPRTRLSAADLDAKWRDAAIKAGLTNG